MKYVTQFLWILLFSFFGELLHYALPLPIPASIYGIILLFCALQFHILPLDKIKETSLFLVEIMPVLFIPAAVGVMDIWDSISGQWLPYLIVTAATTILVMVVAGHVTQFVIRCQEKRKL